MKVTATELRQNLYRILDTSLETGEPVVIERKGRTIRLVPEHAPSVWDRLPPQDAAEGDPEDLVHLDWSGEWTPGV